jgi:hypothetical protein
MEEQRSLYHGSHVRPCLLARLLLQLDDLIDHTCTAVLVSTMAVAIFVE